MTVHVRLFARARDLAGDEHLTLTIGRPATVGRVRSALIERHPTLKAMAALLLAAVHADYASDECVLEDGSEVAFFPPVSGG